MSTTIIRKLAECVKMGMTYYPDYGSVPSHLTRKIRKSYFPPTAEENTWMHLGKKIVYLLYLTILLSLIFFSSFLLLFFSSFLHIYITVH